jgi:hypothetical protein
VKTVELKKQGKIDLISGVKILNFVQLAIKRKRINSSVLFVRDSGLIQVRTLKFNHFKQQF